MEFRWWFAYIAAECASEALSGFLGQTEARWKADKS